MTVEVQSEERGLSVSEQVHAVAEILGEALPEETGGGRSAPEARQKPREGGKKETLAKETIQQQAILHAQAQGAIEARYNDLRAEAAKLQRQHSAIGALIAVDPAAGYARRAELAEKVAALQAASDEFNGYVYQLNAAAQQASAYAIWGGDQKTERREIPQMVEWGRKQGLTDSQMDQIACNPALTRICYKAWRADTGKPAPNAVPRPGGRTPSARTSQPSTLAAQARAVDALLRGDR